MKICPKCEKGYDATWDVCLNCDVCLVDALVELPPKIVLQKTIESQESENKDTFLGFLVLVMFGGLCVFGYQVFLYLKNGSWTSISLVDTALLVAPNNSWLNYPMDWVGMHKILSSIPLSGPLIFIPIGILYISSILE